MNVSVFLVSSSAPSNPNTSSFRSQTNPGLVSKHDIPPFCNGPMLMSKCPVSAIASVPLVQCKTSHWSSGMKTTLMQTSTHCFVWDTHPYCPGEVISNMFGSWYWAPASRHLEVTILHWTILHWLSYEDDHFEVYRSHFPSLCTFPHFRHTALSDI